MFLLGYFVIFVASLLAYFLPSRRRPNNFPPGPKGYPIVGNIAQITKNRHTHFLELGKKYGDIIGLQFGPTNVVVLNKYQDIKEAFNEAALTGRPMSGFVEDRNRGGMRGVILNEGRSWQDQRRFSLRNLRDLGFGKKSMEVLVMDEVNELIDNMAKTGEQPISTQNRFNAAVLNALWSIVAGKRYSHDDPKLLDFFKTLTQIIAQPSLFLILGQFFPAVHKLQKTFPTLFPNKLLEFVNPLYALLDEIVEEHKATLEEGSPRDFIDVYLEAMAKSDDSSSSFYKAEGEKSLTVVMLDLFVAGAETTSSTLSWACLLLALHPKTQEKLHQEIVKVVGNSRHVSLTDRPSMPYLEATIMEVLRYSSLIPLGVPHAATEDTTFHGFSIPKGTVILPNLYGAGRDKSLWSDPDTFNPNRFLSPDGKTLIRNEALIPFSIGKRICLGQSLALDELFLFMGNIFQRLEMKTVGPVEEPIACESFQILLPTPHQLKVIDRLK